MTPQDQRVTRDVDDVTQWMPGRQDQFEWCTVHGHQLRVSVIHHTGITVTKKRKQKHDHIVKCKRGKIKRYGQRIHVRLRMPALSY